MKKVFLLLSVIFCVPCFAQNMKAEIENQFRDYNRLIVENKFNEALDLYGNEDYLRLFPKEELVDMMNKMFNDPQLTINLMMPLNIVVSENVIDQNEKKFVKIDFQQKLEMKFNEAGLDSNNILSALRRSFGNENVKYDETTGFFLIDALKLAVASSSNLKNWQFQILDKKQIPVLKAFIPEQYLKEIK